MSNLALRALTAVVALPLVAALILWREPLGFGVLVMVVCALALTEYAAITLPGAPRRLRMAVVALGVGLSAALYLVLGLAIVWVSAALMATAALQTGGLPQLDLLVRTSGEERLSNFLLWEAAYAELYFTDTFWPAFGKPELYEALESYRGRERRFGRTREQIRSAG